MLTLASFHEKLHFTIAAADAVMLANLVASNSSLETFYQLKGNFSKQ